MITYAYKTNTDANYDKANSRDQGHEKSQKDPRESREKYGQINDIRVQWDIKTNGEDEQIKKIRGMRSACVTNDA